MIISHHQSPLSSWSGSQCCSEINTFFFEHVYLIFTHDYFRCSVHPIIFSPGVMAMVRVSVPPGGLVWWPVRPPDAGTGYVMLSYSDTSPGTPGTFYHSECHWGEIMLGLRRFCEQGVSVVVRWPCSVCWWTGMDQIYWKILFSIVQFSWKWDQRSNVQSSKMLID